MAAVTHPTPIRLVEAVINSTLPEQSGSTNHTHLLFVETPDLAQHLKSRTVRTWGSGIRIVIVDVLREDFEKG